LGAFYINAQAGCAFTPGTRESSLMLVIVGGPRRTRDSNSSIRKRGGAPVSGTRRLIDTRNRVRTPAASRR